MGRKPDPNNAREAILEAAKKAAQSRGYAGLNFRELAEEVGVKHASLYYHFDTKGDLAAAVAKRYWENTAARLEAMAAESPSPDEALRRYPEIFRKSLQDANRMCLASFMSAEYDDLPEAVKTEVQRFADVNVAWLTKTLVATGLARDVSEQRAKAIYAAVAGAQLMARGRSDIALFDALMDGYRSAGLLPA
ncbi:TetR/AcrR family transcriptional regulator [Aquabacterium sp. J223]|uniref:TetR/AcrR family transcriptional regulator n=1 Tax=Aquabacterium sp. J223 TaxID=2898431 RepID=UPI0021AD789F|nr:TetR/AcrR family transcriptional regulator [Aquabacterium sp. J223]UUX94573.1 TetR/AcrR family transcriptional regulator [Aquabacterium sp. J223]